MEKHEIRKEFFRLKNKGLSYSKCSQLIKAQFSYEITPRTLQRWERKLRIDEQWNLCDDSKRPKTIYEKIGCYNLEAI